MAIYMAANYGGSITAVTINAPGTASAVVTAFDGYPLTRQGKPGIGLGVSLVASTIGGLIGTVILIFFSVPLATFAVKCHPAEHFGLTTAASLGGENWAKAFAAMVFGLLLNTIGVDPISGVSRFTFGIPQLYDGFSLIPALIGLFAISEVLTQIERGKLESNVFTGDQSHWPSIRDYWALKFNILRSSLVGTIIGIFPGAGATIAAFISYDAARRVSRNPETFGKGAPEGVAAAEAANRGSVGGALVPLLTLGIPGSATTAVLIGALMIHDLVPGPRLFKENPEIVYGIFASLLVANDLLLRKKATPTQSRSFRAVISTHPPSGQTFSAIAARGQTSRKGSVRPSRGLESSRMPRRVSSDVAEFTLEKNHSVSTRSTPKPASFSNLRSVNTLKKCRW